MPELQQLRILKSGVQTWNFWRDKNVQELIHLGGADLSDADLSHANLMGANLTGANLVRADLSGADLSKANLSCADLSETVFVNVNLSSAIGLESCYHHGPSTLDHRTLLKSGTLPLEFLRGCGLPDHLIEYLPSVLNEVSQLYSCFISYSARDQEFADQLHADLQNKGVRCWFAPEDLEIGDCFRQRIDEAIRLHDKLLLLLSEHSIESDWVRKEVESCLEREEQEKRAVLFPIRLDDAIMHTSQAWAASILKQRHIADFQNWKDHDAYKKGFERLLRDLKAEKRAKGKSLTRSSYR